jgi:hypothetical protein
MGELPLSSLRLCSKLAFFFNKAVFWSSLSENHGPNLFSQKCRAVQQQLKITGLVLFSSAVSQREENRGKKDFFFKRFRLSDLSSDIKPSTEHNLTV